MSPLARQTRRSARMKGSARCARSERSDCLRTSRTASNGHTGGDLRNALPLLTCGQVGPPTIGNRQNHCPIRSICCRDRKALAELAREVPGTET